MVTATLEDVLLVCEHCGHEFSLFRAEVCEVCKARVCPECDGCSCDNGNRVIDSVTDNGY